MQLFACWLLAANRTPVINVGHMTIMTAVAGAVITGPLWSRDRTRHTLSGHVFSRAVHSSKARAEIRILKTALLLGVQQACNCDGCDYGDLLRACRFLDYSCRLLRSCSIPCAFLWRVLTMGANSSFHNSHGTTMGCLPLPLVEAY